MFSMRVILFFALLPQAGCATYSRYFEHEMTPEEYTRTQDARVRKDMAMMNRSAKSLCDELYHKNIQRKACLNNASTDKTVFINDESNKGESSHGHD